MAAGQRTTTGQHRPLLRVDRRLSSRGSIMIARQKIQVGIGHAGRTVTVEADTTFRVYDGEQSLIDEQREPS